MIRLFAALDGSGAMRFIGEVARGAACGCFCPECASPLVAKLGEEREWHFAHEAGQERPECEAGAMNMLRRLAVEHLRVQPRLELPPYVERVSARSKRRDFSEEVVWDAQFASALEWLPAEAKSAPVARGQLDNGIDAELFVEIGGEALKGERDFSAKAVIVFCCLVPALPDLRRRSDAQRHIQQHGRLSWKHQPDAKGLVDGARSRLRSQALADDEEAERWRKREADEAGRRWAQASQRLQHPSTARREGADRGQVTEAVPVRSAVGAGEPEFPWAPSRKPNTSFIFYRMKDGAAWVIYTLQDGSSAIAAWPRAEEGWDEALPKVAGVADAELGVYRITDLTAAMMYFSRRSALLRASSDPRDFEGH
jgi:hypothetical protein